jgi:hypothetical protein
LDSCEKINRNYYIDGLKEFLRKCKNIDYDIKEIDTMISYLYKEYIFYFCKKHNLFVSYIDFIKLLVKHTDI